MDKLDTMDKLDIKDKSPMSDLSIRTGVLLVNLGTPDSPRLGDVHRYLVEFLTDPRVIDRPWLSRQLLVRGMIVPSRVRQSAHSYQQIWTREGSPLKVFGERVRDKLRKRLGGGCFVELAMRYQHPSISEELERMRGYGLNRLLVLPLFPQYASATTGSVHQKVMEEVSRWEVVPEVILANQFATHSGVMRAFCASAASFPIKEYDHILFSFHGLPLKQLVKADMAGHCMRQAGCCQKPKVANNNCYSAQCYATALSIAASLRLDEADYSVAFQSRLGKDPWIQPYMSEVITKLALEGKKKVLVFCPSFVCDCLETTYEIGVEYAAEFKKHGGEKLDLVPGLNDSEPWLEALEEIVRNYLVR